MHVDKIVGRKDEVDGEPISREKIDDARRGVRRGQEKTGVPKTVLKKLGAQLKIWEEPVLPWY